MGKHRDWTEVEKDYQENGLSYAELAHKYGIPLDTLKKAAARQGWTKSKERRAKKAAQKAQSIQANIAEAQMAPNGTSDEMAPNGTEEMAPVVPLYPDKVLPAENDAARFERLVNQLMDRVEDAICNMDVTQAGSVKLMTGALKDLRDLKHLNKTALDIEEQKARIEKLRSETRIIEDDSEYGVILLPARDKVMPPE